MTRIRSIASMWPLAVFALLVVLFLVGMGIFVADPCGVYHLREADEIACRQNR